MPCYGRRLSDYEWANFVQSVNIPALGLPPWGGLITWGGMSVLILLGPHSPDTQNYYAGMASDQEAFLTDVTNCPEWVQAVKNYGTYDPDSESWVAHLPSELWGRTQETIVYAFNDAPAQIQALLQKALENAGKAAAAGLGPILAGLTPVLIGALVILGLMYLPRRQ